MSGAMSDAKSALDRAGFSTPVGMVAAGAIVLLVVEVIFGLILEDYFVSRDYLLLTLPIVVVLVFMGRDATAGKLAPVPVVMKALGYLMAITGAVILIYDLRYPQDTLDEFPDVIGAILAYVGYLLAFLGARSIKV
jgi:hypothetical protein